MPNSSSNNWQQQQTRQYSVKQGRSALQCKFSGGFLFGYHIPVPVSYIFTARASSLHGVTDGKPVSPGILIFRSPTIVRADYIECAPLTQLEVGTSLCVTRKGPGILQFEIRISEITVPVQVPHV